jgi:hypothetical protein
MNEATKDQVIRALQDSYLQRGLLIDFIIQQSSQKEKESNQIICNLRSELAILKELSKESEDV